MYERANKDDRLFVGVRIGGRCTADGILDEIYHFCSSPFVNSCYVLVKEEVEPDLYYKWATALKETKTFFFLHNYEYDIAKDVADKMKNIAGEFYLGAFAWRLNEWGTKSSTAPYWGYSQQIENKKISIDSYDNTFSGEEDIDDLKVSFERNRKVIKERIDECRDLYGGIVCASEATAHIKYLSEGGQDVVFAELMNAYLATQVACARGTTRGYNKDEWIANIAHEWYGGLDNEDPMKLKRLKLAYDYVYMAGANFIYIESGEQNTRSYGVYHPETYRIPQTYKKIREEFSASVKDDVRPLGGPLCKVGIVHGN